MTAIINTNLDASASLDFALPFADIQYLNFFDGGAGVVGRNLVKGKVAPAVVGVPVPGAGYMRMKGRVNYVDTRMGDATLITLISASRAVGVDGTAATRAAFLSGFEAIGLTTGSTSMYADADGAISAATTRNNNGAGTILPAELAIPAGDWSFKVLRVTATQMIFDDITRGRRIVRDLVYPHAVGARSMLVGADHAADRRLGVSDHLFAAVVHRDITDAEMQRVYDMARYRATMRGISL